MQKIRILFTIPNFDTAGSGKALLNLASKLDPTIFEPHIACVNDKGVFFQTVVNSNIPIHILPLYSNTRPVARLLKETWSLSRKIKLIAPDIVHSFNYSADYTEAMAVRMAGSKWVFTKKNMSWGGSSKNAWKLRSSLANKIIAQNTDMLKLFYPGSKKVTLIPRGVNTQEFYFREPFSELKAKWGIAQKAKIILNVANLVPVKGIEVLIAAFNKVKSSLPDMDMVLLIVGDNNSEYGNQLKELVKELGIADKVIFTGKQQNISAYNSIADIFVLPTLDKGRREGSPVALLEAMASGNISLASEIAGIRDQMQSMKEMLFEPGNIDMLASKLISLLSICNTEKEVLQKAMRNIVLEGYTIELEVKRHEDFYLSCINKNR